MVLLLPLQLCWMGFSSLYWNASYSATPNVVVVVVVGAIVVVVVANRVAWPSCIDNNMIITGGGGSLPLLLQSRMMTMLFRFLRGATAHGGRCWWSIYVI